MKTGFTAVSQTAGFVPEVPQREVITGHFTLIAAVAGSFQDLDNTGTREGSSLLPVCREGLQGSCLRRGSRFRKGSAEPVKERATATLRACPVDIGGDTSPARVRPL
jgi:hypothetical protein